MQEPLSFGPWLKQRRRFLDVTQQEIAQRAACSLSTLRKIEAGDLLPSKELAGLLAEALRVPATEHEAFVAFARDERRATLAPTLVAAPAATAVTPAAAMTLPTTRRQPLPPQLTPFIGRETEVAEVQALLTNPACPLLTIVGPGGIGKTRLALAVAQQILDFGVRVGKPLGADNSRLALFASEPEPQHQPNAKSQPLKFDDGVYFVPFVGVATPDFMVSTIANAIGFTFAGAGDPQTQLLNYLSEKAMLLVLDNLEHLLAGVDRLVALLQAAPAVKLLVTSRERLAIQGEWVFELPALATPPQANDEAATALATYPAVTLFVERAQRTSHRFALSAQNEVAVGQICRLVGGMPLGVELAASWVHTLSCTEIATEIARNLDFLAVNHRNLPERQRSVRATFDHSWRLLSPEEQQVLCRLSVFRGGFQREAAATVAGATLPALANLVSKSLVQRTATGRYELHELVRQYAADHLRHEPAEESHARHAHADHFLGTLDDQRGLFDYHHATTRQELLRERENLRAAWLWAAESGRYDLLRSATPTFWYFHEVSSLLHEGEALFAQARQTVSVQQPSQAAERTLQTVVQGDLQARQGWFQFRAGHFSEARPTLLAAVALLQAADDPAALADALHNLSVLEWHGGAFQESQHHARAALRLNQRWGRAWWQAMCLVPLGYATHWQGDYAAALPHFAEALALLRGLGEPCSTAKCLYGLSWTTQALGHHAETQAHLEEALAQATQLDDWFTIALIRARLGLLAHAVGENQEAQALLANALTLFRERGDDWYCASALNALGWVRLALAAGDAAQQAFQEALHLSGKVQFVPSTLAALVGLATVQTTVQTTIETTVQTKSGPAVWGLTVAYFALAHPAITQETKEQAGQLRLRLAATLDPQQWAVAQQQAQQTTLETLVAAVSKSS